MSDRKDEPAKPAPRRGRRCPICAKPTQQDFRPFCSRRCKDVDLGRWLGGEYRIGGHAAYDDDLQEDQGG